MRITYIVPYFSKKWSHAEYYPSILLARKGHEVHIIASRNEGYAPSCDGNRSTYNNTSEKNHRIHVHYIRQIAHLFENPLVNSRDLVQLMKHISPDLVIARDFYPIICSYACKAAKKVEKKFIFRADIYYNLKNLKGLLFTMYIHSWLPQYCIRNSDAAIAISKDAETYHEKLGYKGRTFCIPLGVNIELFKPLRRGYLRKKLDINRNEFTLLSVSRLHPHKNLRMAVHVVSTLVRKGFSMKYVILGRGKDYSKLSELVRKLGMEKNIFIVRGYVRQEDMPRVYSDADVLLMPSIYEPFGLACLEALACGVPVFGGRTGGLRDIVQHGLNGYLLNTHLAHDAGFSELADYLKRFYSMSDEERVIMRQEARKRAVCFSWDKVVESYENVFEDICE